MTNAILVQAHGHNGQIELTDTVVRIRRKGVLGFLTQGLKGDKEILIGQISSVQYKGAGMLVNGYIQFAFVGGQEAKGGAFQAASDENTVMFTRHQQPEFDRFRTVLQSKMNQARQPVAQLASTADELEKLAILRDRGILTEAEFQAKKRQVLGL